MERTGDRALTIMLDGGATCTAGLSVVRRKRQKLGKFTVTTAGGDSIRPFQTSPDRIDYTVAASGQLILTWK